MSNITYSDHKRLAKDLMANCSAPSVAPKVWQIGVIVLIYKKGNRR